MREGGVRMRDRYIERNGLPTFRIDNAEYSQLFLGHAESSLQILQRLFWVAVVVAEEVGAMAVQDGTERHAVPPTGVEVGHLHLLVATEGWGGRGGRGGRGGGGGEGGEGDNGNDYMYTVHCVFKSGNDKNYTIYMYVHVSCVHAKTMMHHVPILLYLQLQCT